MNAVFSIARITFIQQFRNRLYLIVLFFGALMLFTSLLFGAIAADQGPRVILDAGLAVIEWMGLVTAVFGAVTLILEEMESRTIYLLLTRPLPRLQYILGRAAGLLLAVGASVLLMGMLHVGLLTLKGWEWNPRYFVSLPFVGLKITMVTCLALFFSLFSSSAVSSVVFTFFFWILGHFGQEIKHLASQAANPLTPLVMKALMFVTPQLHLLNQRDMLDARGAVFDWVHLGGAALYALLYSAGCLLLSHAFFSRKEF